jgi:acyl carrier protein
MSTSPENPSTQTVGEADMTAWLIGRIRFYDQVDPATVTPDAPLAELGLDSIYVMTLCGDIEDTFGSEIDPTFFADYATLGELADALSDRVGGS